MQICGVSEMKVKDLAKKPWLTFSTKIGKIPRGVPTGEQETIIALSRDSAYADIWTSDNTMITRLSRSAMFKVLEVTATPDGIIVIAEGKMPKTSVFFKNKERRGR